jgi:hypothetical protein
MSGNCAVLSVDPLARFKTIWDVDFEYQTDVHLHPRPTCMFAREQRSGREIFMWRSELLVSSSLRAPFDTGPDDLVIAYSSPAEMSCFRMLGWSTPHNVLDAYVETIAAINGLEIEGLKEKRPNLVEALQLFGLPVDYNKATKDAIRDLIINTPEEDLTNEQRAIIKPYNISDVTGTARLLPMLLDASIRPSSLQLLPTLDLSRALHRGRFMCSAITPQEMLGLPIDVDCFNLFFDNWDFLRRYYITRDDEFGLYDDLSFVEARLEELVAVKGWPWPRTDAGHLKKDARTFGKLAQRYPELKRTAHMRNIIGELRLNDIASAVAADGFLRCWLAPFWSRTGRNQPPGKVFLPALPAWLRGWLRPPRGWTLIELDYNAEEIWLLAGQSKDQAMIADCQSGDFHWAFGIRAGLVPPGAIKADHQELRSKMLKPVSLGQNYGQTPHGIARATGRSLRWARDAHARHHHTYRVCHDWINDVAVQAKFDRRICSPFGWPMAVTGDTKHRTLLNFMAQAAGADAMRIVGIAAYEAGIRVCCSVHDSFWILAPTGDEARTIAKMTEIMKDAAVAVCGLPIEVEIKAVITSNNNYGSSWKPKDRGYDMWHEVCELLEGRSACAKSLG